MWTGITSSQGFSLKNNLQDHLSIPGADNSHGSSDKICSAICLHNNPNIVFSFHTLRSTSKPLVMLIFICKHYLCMSDLKKKVCVLFALNWHCCILFLWNLKLCECQGWNCVHRVILWSIHTIMIHFSTVHFSAWSLSHSF